MRAGTLVTIALAGLAATSGYLWKELRDAHAVSQRASAEVETLRSQVASLNEALRGAKEQSAARSAAPQETAKVENPAPGPKQDSVGPRLPARPLVLDDAGRAAQLALRKSGVRTSYPDVGRSLNFTQAQEDALLGLLARQEIEEQDVLRRTPGSQAERDAAAQQMYDRHRQEQAELLGYDGKAKFDEYQKTRFERLFVTQLRARLPAAAPLNEAQESALIAGMNDEKRRFLNDATQEEPAGVSTNYPIMFLSRLQGGTSPIDVRHDLDRSQAFMKRLHDRAAGILNQEQLRRFDELQEQQLAGMRVNAERVRLQQAATR